MIGEMNSLIYTELLVVRLFTQRLAENECVIGYGCEEFNRFEIDASRLSFLGQAEDKTALDNYQRRKRSIVIISKIPPVNQNANANAQSKPSQSPPTPGIYGHNSIISGK